MKNEIEKMLKDYRNATKSIRSKNREENVLKLLEMREETRKNSDFLEFVRGQFGLMGRFGLVWELAWLAVFVVLFYYGKELFFVDLSVPFISMLSPLLLIVFATDIGKVTNRSILEIEASTKYSISQILLFRSLVYEVVQLVVILLGAVICQKSLGYSLFHILIYGYTPLIFSSALLLACIGRFSGRSLQYAGVSITVLTVSFLGIMSKMEFAKWNLRLFDLKYIWIWETALAVSVVVYGMELVMIRKGVRVHGIGTMRSIEML